MGLAVEAVRGSCVLHRAGHLSMEGCRLSCDAKDLPEPVEHVRDLLRTGQYGQQWCLSNCPPDSH
eukprot:1157304-Pelagomonas_calceolata.AAC.4